MKAPLEPLLLVAAGGAFGSVCRYLVSTWGAGLSGGRFPLGTLLVNLVGCFVIGLFAAMSERFRWFTPSLWLLLCTGVTGGFTTFSAFGLETFHLLRRKEWLMAGGYISASMVGGLLLLWLGYSLLVSSHLQD